MPRAKLTEKYIDRLPYSFNTIEYYDTRIVGFGVRVGSSSKTYFVKGAIGSKQFKRKIGKVGRMSLEEAAQEAENILKLADKGIAPAKNSKVVEDVPQHEVTLRSVTKEYLATRKVLKASTRNNYTTMLDRYLSDWLDVPMQSITPAMVVIKHAEIGKKSEACANSTFRIVRALFNFSMEVHAEITADPVRRLSTLKAWYKNKRKVTFIRPSQLPIFFKALQQHPDNMVADYLKVLLFTGLRGRSELAGVEIKHVDITDKTLMLYDTKSKDYLMIPLCNTALEILKLRIADAQKNKTSFLFYAFQGQAARTGIYSGIWKARDTGRPFSDIRGNIELLLGNTDLDFITPHDLRRTFLTYADELEIPNVVQKRLVGHALPMDVTDGYKVLTMERLRSAIEKIEAFILAQAGPD